ncbi:hypothetical protein Scep_016162 [Stephania cephalantha]|uniref:Uncharacterized protein n=1 Tax=Stephania cephalantha TaxID=152367 RepID=A0AAP0IM36_9MAGN
MAPADQQRRMMVAGDAEAADGVPGSRAKKRRRNGTTWSNGACGFTLDLGGYSQCRKVRISRSERGRYEDDLDCSRRR